MFRSPVGLLVLLNFSAFGSLGLAWGVWQALLPELQNALSLSNGQLGLALSAGLVGSIPAMRIGGKLADRYGAGRLMALMAGVMGLSVVSMAGVDRFSFLCMGLTLFCMSSAIYDVAINAVAVRLENVSKQHWMTFFHAAYSGVSAVAALTAGLGAQWAGGFRHMYVVIGVTVLGLAGLLWWARERLVLPIQTPSASDGSAGSVGIFRNPTLLILAVVTALCFLAESTLETWSAIYLRQSLAVSVAVGAAGPAAFHAAMFIGRMSSGWVIRRIGRYRLLQLAGWFAMIGMALALSTQYVPLVLGGILLTGLALSGVAPAGYSLAGEAAPQREGAVISSLAALSYIGFLVGPVLIGAVAEAWGLRVALGLIAVAGGIMAAFSSVLARRNR